MYDPRMPRALVFTLATVVLFSSSLVGIPRAESVMDSEPTFRPVTNVKQTMEWILDPAVDVIWDSAGFIITAEGERDLSPTTDERWSEVRNSAATVAEAGNLLMMPGRAAGPDWIAYARALVTAGETAIAAAQAQDADALFDAGGEVYIACRSCHEQFLIPIEEARNAK